MDFKKFVSDKINYFATHFKRRAVLLDECGEPHFEINLSFDELSDEYMARMDEMEKSSVQMDQSTMKMGDFEGGIFKITDKDLQPLWEDLSSCYTLCFNVQGQNITDETLLKIAELYESGRCTFKELKLKGNQKISQIGAVRLATSLKDNETIKKISFNGICLGLHGANRISELIASGFLNTLDLGLIGNESMKYLSGMLEHPHKLQKISFGEDESDPWKEDGKNEFQKVLRRGEFSKSILSTNLYTNEQIKHWDLINELNILCRKRRNLKVNERQNQFKVASLNPNHSKYYDPENHSVNAYKFSVKSYLTNVFGSDLDQALYFLQKERRNSLREEAIFQITKQPINKLILEDICTADGSIVVLAKYLLNKIHDKNNKEQI